MIPSHDHVQRQEVLVGEDIHGKGPMQQLFTPLFKYFDIDLSAYTVNPNIEYIDIQYLIKCHILQNESTYTFLDKEGTQLFCKLPQPDITRLDVFENISFLPVLEFLCDDPRAPPPDDIMDDVEDFTPHGDANYDLGPIADDADDTTYRLWMIDSQHNNNSL